MYRTYLLSDEETATLEACKKALEDAFPHLTFDTDTYWDIKGVRVHTDTYDSPVIEECRIFVRGFVAGLKLAED